MTPILVDDPILALGITVNFPPWERFFNFPFQSYSCFRKKIRLTRQKVFPPPTVGVPSASKSPSALSAQALRASRAGLINSAPELRNDPIIQSQFAQFCYRCIAR